MNKLKNNRYLPFIIIVVVLLLLLIVNVLTSKSKHTYTKNDITFTYDSDTQSTTVENNVSSSTDNATEAVENTQSVEETYYEDTQESDETSYEEPNTDNNDMALEDDSEPETKLFSSKEQLENIALGYLNQGRKYRKFFNSKELFEKRNEMPIYDCLVKSSDLKNKTVTIKCRYDGDDDSLQTVKLQFKVENNKITDVTIK